MLSFDFLEKDLGIVSVPHFASHVLLTDQFHCLIAVTSWDILQYVHQLVSSIKNNIDILMISEIKIDNSFPTMQFHFEGYCIG